MLNTNLINEYERVNPQVSCNMKDVFLFVGQFRLFKYR